MPNATAELEAEVVRIPVLIQRRYEGYKITHLFDGETGARYFRVTKYGINADGNTCILRSAFVKLRNGEITES